MDSCEEEALFRSYPYAALYFVQSPTTTTTTTAAERRLTLSHYSSSHGSTNSFLHDAKIPHQNHVVKMGEAGGQEKKMWGFLSFSKADSCVWIWFQISLRLMVSFGVALLFFYLITRPPPPIIFVKMGIMNEFELGEGVDHTGVTTKFLTCNCSINLHVNVKSNLYGLHIHPLLLTLSFNNIPLATSSETGALYASSNRATYFLQNVGTMNKPMYGAGGSMQDMLDSANGLSLVVGVKLSSRFHVVGNLISPKYHHQAKCVLVLNRNQHKTLMFHNHCNML